MTQKLEFSLVNSEDIENALCDRLEDVRLSRNISQNDLAEEAGISRSTITRLATHGKGISLDSFIRVMQALQLTSHLEALLPDPTVRPVERVKFKGVERQRARAKKKNNHPDWTWETMETTEKAE